MSFHISETGEAEHKVVLLQDQTTGTKAEIFAFGALLNGFSVDHKETERNIIEGYRNTEDAIKNIVPSFQSAKLSPFVCRLKEGHYTFANEKYKVEKYYHYREALHGLVYDAVFSVEEAGTTCDSAFVVLSYDYHKNDPGFPFFYRLQITYRLKTNNELVVTTNVTNQSSVSIPMSDGWHPYFTLQKKVDDLELYINTREMVEFNERLLPTGNALPFQKFSHPSKIGDLQLDNSFILSIEDGVVPACTLTNTEDGLQLRIYPDNNYPYLQIFIPDHRNSIAIENLSSLPDAFNNGFGLIVLKPSASASFTTKFIIAAI